MNVAELSLLDGIRMQRDLPHIRLEALDVPRHLIFRLGGRLARTPDHVLKQGFFIVQLAETIDHNRRLQCLTRQAAQRPARVPRLIVIHDRLGFGVLRSHKVVSPRYRAPIISLSLAKHHVPCWDQQSPLTRIRVPRPRVERVTWHDRERRRRWPLGLAERDHHVLPRTYAAHSCLEKSRSSHRVASVVLWSVHGGVPYVRRG